MIHELDPRNREPGVVLWIWCSISMYDTKLVQEFSIWKFWCQNCTSLWCSVKNLTDRISICDIDKTKRNRTIF